MTFIVTVGTLINRCVTATFYGRRTWLPCMFLLPSDDVFPSRQREAVAHQGLTADETVQAKHG